MRIYRNVLFDFIQNKTTFPFRKPRQLLKAKKSIIFLFIKLFLYSILISRNYKKKLAMSKTLKSKEYNFVTRI